MFFPSIVYVCVFVSDGDPREHQISCASMRKTSTHLQLRSNGVRDETKHTPRGQSSRFQTECDSGFVPNVKKNKTKHTRTVLSKHASLRGVTCFKMAASHL